MLNFMSVVYLSEINCCVFMKLQRQLCNGNADAKADDRDDDKYLLSSSTHVFHKELMGHIMRKPVLSYLNKT